MTATTHRMLPLYEGKMSGFFDHRAADVVVSDTAQVRQGQPQPISDASHTDPTRVAIPRFWVSENVVRERSGDQEYLQSFRDLTSPTNERTVISTVLPVVGVGHTQPLIQADTVGLLIALLNSFVFDYVARQKVGGIHLTYGYLKQLPIPAPESLVGVQMPPLLLELSYTAWDMAPFARSAGVEHPPFRWDPERRALLRAELDALMFRLYGIERDDVDYILDTFPIVKRKDQAKFGEFRTKRLILERFDAMDAADVAGEEYVPALDPPPADPSLCHPESTRPDWAR